MLEYGQHKRTYCSFLEDSMTQGAVGADSAAMEASCARLRQEARQALVRAGSLFKEVVLVRPGCGPLSV